jgi:NAD+-dependent protein deacetylase SIR2
MKVAPVSEIPLILPKTVPQIYISRDEIHHIDFDINLIGYCDVIVAAMCKTAGWNLQHNMIPKEEKFEVETEIDKPWLHKITALKR